MKIDIQLFALEGCRCRIKFDPKDLQTLLDSELKKKFEKQAKHFHSADGDLTVSGAFSEIDEGNFAVHFMLAFLGKAWIAGTMSVHRDGAVIVEEPYRISRTFSAFTGGKSQLQGDVKFLADQVLKKTLKAFKAVG